MLISWDRSVIEGDEGGVIGDGTLSPSGPNSGIFGFDEADVRSGKDAAVGEAVNDVRRLVGSPPEADGARGPLTQPS
eukprot:scaffold5890_cov110-Isochrysis_galbana.AAC.3